MRVRLKASDLKGLEGIAKPVECDFDDGYGQEYEVDILNPDGSVLEYGVFYGEDEIEIL